MDRGLTMQLPESQDCSQYQDKRRHLLDAWKVQFAIRERSSFIAGGGGAAEDFGWDHYIFRRTKGGIIRNWYRGDHWKLWKDSEGSPLKFAWKMKTLGGGGGGGEIKNKRGDRLKLTLFSPKSSAPRPLPPAINNDRSLSLRIQPSLLGSLRLGRLAGETSATQPMFT